MCCSACRLAAFVDRRLAGRAARPRRPSESESRAIERAAVALVILPFLVLPATTGFGCQCRCGPSGLAILVPAGWRSAWRARRLSHRALSRPCSALCRGGRRPRGAIMAWQSRLDWHEAVQAAVARARRPRAARARLLQRRDECRAAADGGARQAGSRFSRRLSRRARSGAACSTRDDARRGGLRRFRRTGACRAPSRSRGDDRIATSREAADETPPAAREPVQPMTRRISFWCRRGRCRSRQRPPGGNSAGDRPDCSAA